MKKLSLLVAAVLALALLCGWASKEELPVLDQWVQDHEGSVDLTDAEQRKLRDAGFELVGEDEVQRNPFTGSERRVDLWMDIPSHLIIVVEDGKPVSMYKWLENTECTVAKVDAKSYTLVFERVPYGFAKASGDTPIPVTISDGGMSYNLVCAPRA